MDDLVEKCLRIWHGDGAYGWGLIKNQWPDAAIDGQRRRMADIICEARSTNDLANEVRRLSGCLLAIAGAEGCGNGALRTAAYEAATMGATVAELASKLALPSPLR